MPGYCHDWKAGCEQFVKLLRVDAGDSCQSVSGFSRTCFKKIRMNINVVAGCVYRQGQSAPIGNRSSVDKQIILLSLNRRLSGQLLSLDNLQIVQPGRSDNEEH